MKRFSHRLVSLLVILALVGSLTLLLPGAQAQTTYKGSDYTANAYVAGRLDVILSEFPVGSYYTFDGKGCTHHGSGCSYFGGCNCRSYIYDAERNNKMVKFNSIQCMGFAHYCFYKIFGFIDRSEYDTSLYQSIGSLSKEEMTAANCRNLILKAQTGAHIRIANKHSMVYLSGDANGFTVLHCNADAQCGVSVKTWTWESFASNFKSWGIGYINMPKVYPNSSGKSTIAAAREQYPSGSSVTLNWTMVAGVPDYTVKIYSHNPATGKDTLVKTSAGLTGSTTTVSSLAANTTYRADIYCGKLTTADSSAWFYLAAPYTGVASKTVREGSFALKNLNLTKMMNVSSVSAEGTAVSLAARSGAATQQFYFSYEGSGMYHIYAGSADNTKVLTVKTGSDGAVAAGNGLMLSAESPQKSYAQLFYCIESSGNYYFESVSKPGYVLNGGSDGSITVKARAQSLYHLWQFCDNKGAVVNPAEVNAKHLVGTYTITTSSTSLNIRNGAGTSYSKVGSVPKGATVQITAIENDWGYLTYNNVSGWISLDYATFVSAAVTMISIANKPAKLVYELNEKIDSTGLSIKVVRSDNTTTTLTTGFTLNYDFSTAGSKTVVVNYAGKTTTYPVTVRGGLPTEMTSEIYSVNAAKGTLTNISANVTLDEFLGGFYASDYIVVMDGSKEIGAQTKIGTGMTVKLTDGTTVAQSLTAVVTGDTNGDGTIDITDLIQIKAHLLQTKLLTGNAFAAADTNNDGIVDITDFIQVKAHLLGKSSVKPHA